MKLTASFFWIIVSLNDCGFNLFGSEINMIKFICYGIMLTALFAIVYQRKGVARGVLGCFPDHLCNILTDKKWQWNSGLFHPNFFLFCNVSLFTFSSSGSISLFSTLAYAYAVMAVGRVWTTFRPKRRKNGHYTRRD